MKTKPNTSKLETAPAVPVRRSSTAILPCKLLAGLKHFSVRSRACGRDGYILGAEDRLTGASVRSCLKVLLGGEAGLVSRVSALLLLQTGGRADIGPSRNFGGSLSLVTLPVGVELEVR